MTATVSPGPRTGRVTIPASKSQAHRLLICAALGREPVELVCGGPSADILATAKCLNALGADIQQTAPDRFSVRPIAAAPGAPAQLACGESGSTLRFLLPLVGALGAEGAFVMEGRLPQRPLAPFDSVLKEHGMTLHQEGSRLRCGGQLRPGDYTLPGDVSSQYISGLLMALPRLAGDSTLTVTGHMESAGYVAMTEDALRLSGIRFTCEGQSWRIPGGQRCRLPRLCRVEGDWSNAAPWLCMGAIDGDSVTVKGLDPDSQQGDRAVCRVLGEMGVPIHHTADRYTSHPGRLHPTTIDARDIPDLVPVLAALAASIPGTTIITGAARLRLKESDRLATTAATLNALGSQVEVTDDGLILQGKAHLLGGTVDAAGDHRIAMAAAVAACACSEPVVITGAQAVEKSYPTFWHDLRALGKPVEEAP